jgi:D-alanyl-D-alanine carboxypeptidase
MRLPLRAMPLLIFSIALSAVAAAPDRLSQGRAIAAVKAELQKEVADGRFSGSVMIAKDGRPIFEEAYGYADQRKKIKNSLETKFRFGSLGKMFTAVAILQLVQHGQVQLDDTVSKFIPGYPNKEVAAVTVYQLLTHTGGTGDIFGPDFDAKRNDMKTLQDYLTLYGQRDAQFKPGSMWDYSNYGFILLGRIIEEVSGQSYYDYVREHVFDPAGMQSTGNTPEDEQVPNLAVGYTRAGQDQGQGPGPEPGAGPGAGAGGPPPALSGPLQSTQDMLPYRGTSAGGGYSTVGDLLRFVNALTLGRLIDARYTQLLTTGKVTTPRRGIKYAFGFEDQLTPDGVRLYGHGGGSPGMNGRLSVFPDSGYVVAVLANLDPPAADQVARFIQQKLPVR